MSQSNKCGSISAIAVRTSAALTAILVSQLKFACSCRSIKRPMMISSSMINILIMCSDGNGERITQSVVPANRHLPVQLAGKVLDEGYPHGELIRVFSFFSSIAIAIVRINKLQQMVIQGYGLHADARVGVIVKGMLERIGEQL